MALTIARSLAAGGVAALAAVLAGGGVSHASPRRDTACAVPSRYATIQALGFEAATRTVELFLGCSESRR